MQLRCWGFAPYASRRVCVAPEPAACAQMSPPPRFRRASSLRSAGTRARRPSAVGDRGVGCARELRPPAKNRQTFSARVGDSARRYGDGNSQQPREGLRKRFPRVVARSLEQMQVRSSTLCRQFVKDDLPAHLSFAFARNSIASRKSRAAIEEEFVHEARAAPIRALTPVATAESHHLRVWQSSCVTIFSSSSSKDGLHMRGIVFRPIQDDVREFHGQRATFLRRASPDARSMSWVRRSRALMAATSIAQYRR